MLTLGERLKGLREDLDLLQKNVAAELNISSNTLSNYERDERIPDHTTLIQLANIYHVNIDYLLGNTDIKTSWKNYTEQVELQDRVVSSGKLVEDLNQLSLADREHFVALLESLAQKSKA